MSDETRMIPGGIRFGMPVLVSPVVPRDEVWLRTKDDIVRLVNLANGEAEVERLRRRVAVLEGRLARVLRFVATEFLAYRIHHPGTNREWRHFTKRGSAWSRSRARGEGGE